MQSIRSTLKPAYGLISERTAALLPVPISIPVTILRRNMPEVRCHSVNISEGGMAVSTFVRLNAGEDVQVQFTLPDHKVPFMAESTICWLKNGQSRSPTGISVARAQVRAPKLAREETGGSASRIRCSSIPEAGNLLHHARGRDQAEDEYGRTETLIAAGAV
jgi:Tfp pilus assembly protein PilZ